MTYNSVSDYDTLQSDCGRLQIRRGVRGRKETRFFFTSIEDAGAESQGYEITRAHT